MKRLLTVGFLGLLTLLIFAPPAHAYIDPGTGSYFLQILLAGIAAGLLGIKLLWGRIRALFSGTPSEPGQPKNEND